MTKERSRCSSIFITAATFPQLAASRGRTGFNEGQDRAQGASRDGVFLFYFIFWGAEKAREGGQLGQEMAVAGCGLRVDQDQ